MGSCGDDGSVGASTSASASAGGSGGTGSCGVKVVVGRCWQWSWL